MAEVTFVLIGKKRQVSEQLACSADKDDKAQSSCWFARILFRFCYALYSTYARRHLISQFAGWLASAKQTKLAHFGADRLVAPHFSAKKRERELGATIITSEFRQASEKTTHSHTPWSHLPVKIWEARGRC